MNKMHFNVNGIANTQMKTALKNALDKMEGVQSVHVSKSMGTVEVGFNAPANEQTIKNCIEHTGFHLEQ